MKEFLLPRDTQGADGTFGTWCDQDGNVLFQTLEPESPMPSGTYDVVLRFSPSHGYAVPGFLAVPHHDNIELHPGNTIADSKDCVLPGDSRGQATGIDGVTRPGVLNSRATMQAFMASIGVPNYRDLKSWDDVRSFLLATPDAGRFSVTITDPSR